MIDKYMTWDKWNKFEFINYASNVAIWSMYQEYIKSTCKNVPCWDCLQNSVRYSHSDKRTFAKGKRIEVTIASPRRFELTKNGQKILNDI